MKDYYKILDIPRNTSKDEIQKAFRKLAIKYHPDKKTGDEKKFKDINEAYTVLSNDQKRANYDKFGNEDAGGFSSQGDNNFDFSDIFSDFFNNSTHGQNQKRGYDIEIREQITFEESLFDLEKEISFFKEIYCLSCQGTGGDKKFEQKTCSVCQGQGEIISNQRTFLGVIQTKKNCSTCSGQGKIYEKKCSTCSGHGIIKDNFKIKIKIPAGIESNESLRVRNEGQPIKNGQAGDLLIRIMVINNSRFQRSDLDLITEEKISITSAVLGDKLKIKTPYKEISYKIPNGTQSGDILRVKDEGIKLNNYQGNLLIKINIDIPKKISREEKKIFESLREKF